ncbi:hypothetical protein BDY21DRAFT_277537 [Lineolata rhizophorae]|uniref:4-coumarate-CoA ligase n=1 Tax=Lineolata rhizophorae TaxID=578093 RepID=A0A6A6PFQ9_9PEZI|nr:hypothetical protein BDY21DRAFT_277537 [Lineolata rhizophorae]
MPYRSRWIIDIPNVTLPTYIFTSPNAPLPATPLLIDANRPDTHYLSLSTYRLWSQRLAAGLRAAGLQPGDRVLLFSGNTIFFPVVVLGLSMAGGVFTGANPTYVARELAYQLSDSEARFLIASEESLDVALEAASIAGVGKDRVFVFDDGTQTLEGRGEDDIKRGVRHWSVLLADEETGRRFEWEDDGSEEVVNRTIALNYSSGTTGLPKGVMISHRNYVANTMQSIQFSEQNPDYEAKLARSRLLCFLPMYHAMAQASFVVWKPRCRVPCYIMPKFDFIQMLQNLERFRVTELAVAPPIAVALVKHPATRKYNLSSIESIGSGAAPLGREICAELERMWPEGRINVKQGWGMTELTCMGTNWDPTQYSGSYSVGELAANCEAKIAVDDEGKIEASTDERGEIWFRGPNVMKGYWKKPEATRETISPDGWLKTGDIAFVDENGKFYIVDRKKELIKVKGLQVAPAELEALLLEHPGVADAAVIGVNSEREGEVPRAYVVRSEGSLASAEEIIAFLDSKVSRPKRLAGGVKFLEAIPKNPSGKIQRQKLREMVKAESGTKARL